MKADVAIIGGTGVSDRLLASEGETIHIPTREGVVRGKLVRVGGASVFVTLRHSAGHKVPPHHVNYRAMALGLKQLGVKACLATAAVGSLRTEWVPGTFVVCSDFIDMTSRNLTLFDRKVSHRDMSEPFSQVARQALLDSAMELGIVVESEGVYLSANGPRYETPQEIRAYGTLGADLVGMTAVSEAVLMREAGLRYACLAIVTNLAAGISATELGHGEVVDEMVRSGENAVRILWGAAARLANA